MRYDFQGILTQAMASSGNSSILDLRNVVNMSLQFIVSAAASPTGTVKILFADDVQVRDNGIIPNTGNFGTDPAAPAAPVVTANGTYLWMYANVGHLFCQVQYTAGTGTGNLQVNMADKGV